MLTLQLEALFTPELLTAYRESWGSDPKGAADLAAEIIGMFESPSDKKQALLRDVALALVGEEPDLHAWVAAFACGSFELRPETTYGRAKGKGSPSRFVKRQRALIDSLIAERLPEAERNLRRLAYQDALQLIVASMVVRELRIGVAAKAAIGPGWPIMVAVNEHLMTAEKRDLHSFGGDENFQLHLAKSVSDAISSWMDSPLCDQTPVKDHSPSRNSQLPPGVEVPDALAYLDRGTAAVYRYRTALLGELGLGIADKPSISLSAQELALADATTIGAAHLRRTTACHEIRHTDLWRHFEEARDENAPFTYDVGAIERLRGYLPILSALVFENPEVIKAAIFAMDRDDARKKRPESLLDLDLQIEINTWVTAGLPPPSTLKREHAGMFEQDVCWKWLRAYGTQPRPPLAEMWDARWEQLGVGPMISGL